MKQFLIIFLIVIIIQIPGWILALGRDSGQIADFGNERLIMVYDWGATFFSLPFYYLFRDSIKTDGLAFAIYCVDLVIISILIHLMITGIKKVFRTR
jgi:hypothetical protein